VHLSTLTLTNFRNYRSLTLDCGEQSNLFLGANGQGKTNLLEAIYYLCVARSCREAQDKDLVTLEGDHFLIKGIGISATGYDVELEIRYATRTGKKVLINDQPQRTLSDLFGSMAAVVMSPDDRRLVQGSPGNRRRFLDMAIAQTSPQYLTTLQNYRRVVRQRNEALRFQQFRSDDTQDLELWNVQLIDLGSRIIRKRQEVIINLDEEARQLHRVISDGREELSVRYNASFLYEDATGIESAFRTSLNRAEKEERARGVTVVGPHRDDVHLTINGVTLSAFGSQGQHKTAATAIKLAEARFMWQQMQTPPLLLLDDIFAELDNTRTSRLIELLPDYGQVFITAAKESDFGPYGDQFRQFSVQGGTVLPM